MSKKIVVLQRGWVVIGDVSQEGNHIRVDNSSIIRRWGTTKGLGELAANGPRKETVLDPCGIVRAHELAVVLTIDTEASLWS